ncbi:TPA: hypothetical protein ACF352_004722, partial [Escherichia coli]
QQGPPNKTRTCEKSQVLFLFPRIPIGYLSGDIKMIQRHKNQRNGICAPSLKSQKKKSIAQLLSV